MTSQVDELSLAGGEWKPIPRISRVIPFGYELDPEDPNTLLPIPLELQALVEAKKHVKRYSYRDVANWLSVLTGRSISHTGLKKRLEIERNRRSKARTFKSWTTRIENLKAKTEEFENRLGAKS